MTYHPLTDDSGQTPERRAEEAQHLLKMLENSATGMQPNELKFIAETAARFEQYGPRTIVSVKQLFWLRDLRDKYL